MKSKYWTTRDGRQILWQDLSDDHLNNVIGMLSNNMSRHPTSYLRDARKELFIREVSNLLKLNKDKLAWWLLSTDKNMREIAERASRESVS